MLLINKLILYTTDRKTITLRTVVPAQNVASVVQEPVPGIGGLAFGRTPPVTAVPNVAECPTAVAECPTAVAVTTRQSCEARTVIFY